MTQTEALRLALEALEYYHSGEDYFPTPASKAITIIKATLEANEFNPDWDTQVVLVEEIQRMAKRIEELEAKDEPFEYWNAVEGWVKIDEVRDHFDSVGCGTIYKTSGEDRVPLYTTLPQRTWVGLTDEDFQPMVQKAMVYYGYDPEHSTLTSGAGFYALARAIEAKLKDKNNG